VNDAQTALIDEVRQRFGAKTTITDSGDVEPWLTDWRGRYQGKAGAILAPASTAEVAEIVRLAAQRRVPLVPQGGNTSMVGGATPPADGSALILSLRRMNAIRSISAEHNAAVAEAGVILAHLHEQAAAVGRRFPLTLGARGSCTIGGLVSTNAGGTQVLRFGTMRSLVAGLESVLPDGSIHDGLSGLKKDNRGYSLDQLLIGAEGTLGIVTSAVWRLDPVPAARAGLRVSLRALEDVADAVASLLVHAPSAVELLDRTFLELVGETGPEAVLLVELERDDSATAREAVERAAAAVAPWAASVDPGFTAAAAERLWALRHAASPILAGLPESRRSLQVIEDGCVPVERMGEYVRAVREAAAERGLAVVIFGHAGDGHVHVNLLPEIGRAGWEDAVASLLEAVTDALVRLGGTPSGEHGDGRLRAGLLARVYGEEVVALFARVKRAFDPLGILNPGVILPGADAGVAGRPIRRLKVGEHAVALPDDIARALRRIEQRGGYAQPRLELADGLPTHP
jgi:FAD/FMN-containing dehydrogenase